ncbi:MAG: PKD domain-containing protein [Planctomycetota bacterium]|nr:PKD domain-containing protein [Planctomycetota bacterium]
MPTWLRWIYGTASNSAAGGAGVGVKGGDIRGIGGGLYVGAPLAVHNSTIVRNSARGGNPSLGAQNGGGVYYRWYDGGTNELPSNIINSIVAENKAVASDGATQAADDFDGDVDGASADNIFGSNLGLDGATNGTNGNQIGTAAVPLDPKLGPLGDNGGPTQTHTLLAGSPALDAGSNPDNQTWDQRGDGFPRVQGTRCDVGATEAQPPTLNAGGPYTIAEGDPLDLDGSQSTSPDGRTLTFSWDVNGDGTFGDAAGATPTLTWPQLQALGIDDGPKTFAMAVQISDGIYTTAGTVTLTLNNAPPTPTIVGLPPVATVGVPINLTSSVTDPSAADTAAGFTYAWTVTKDGNPFASGTTAEFSFTPDGAGAYVVTLTATDKDGGKGTDTKSLAGNNPPVVSPPVITPTDPVVGEPVTVIVSPSDPDGDPLTITYDYGDGSSDTTGTHVYTTPGTYTITVTVSDGGSTVTTQITITVGYNLIVTKLKGHALYGRSGKDWAHVTAILPGLPAGFDPTGKTLTVDVGGATATFVLSKTGKANTKDGMARVQLSYAKRPNAKGRAFAGGPVRLWVHLRGTWSDDWVDDGIDMAQHVRKKPIVMPVKVKLDDKTYGGTPNALLTTAEHMYASFLFHQRR